MTYRTTYCDSDSELSHRSLLSRAAQERLAVIEAARQSGQPNTFLAEWRALFASKGDGVNKNAYLAEVPE